MTLKHFIKLFLLFFHLTLISQNNVFALTHEGMRTTHLIASSQLSHCAILKTGQINCWGFNDSNGVPLGNGSGGSSNVGVLVSGINNAVSITAGTNHFCALLANGTVKCWGDNYYGQLGNGTSGNYSNVPVTVAGLSNVKFIVAGAYTTYAVLNSITYSWGAGAQGQLGNGTNTAIQSTPVSSFIPFAIDISAGSNVGCSVGINGLAYCWGASSPSFAGSNIPVLVSGSSYVKAITVQDYNDFSACVLLANGQVQCWGSNVAGNLGLGTVDSSAHSSPSTITAVGDIIDLETSSRKDGHCGIKADNRQLYCWGSNYYGEIGDYTTTNRPAPAAGLGLSGPVVAVTSSLASTCALLANGNIQCSGYGSFGAMGNGSLSSRTSFGSNVTLTSLARTGSQVYTSGRHACGKTAAGGMRCWGANASGQVGDGTTTTKTTPVTTSLYTFDESISASGSHSCALLADGTAQCWGDNTYGQLGDGSNTNSSVARDVSGLLNYKGIAIATGEAGSSCALLSDGTIKCWGLNNYGQLGDGTTNNRNTPVTAISSEKFKAVAQGGYHTCAITEQNNVYCWGLNNYGQLGDGTYVNKSVPSNSAITGYVAITAGMYHTCALADNGRVACWGRTDYGQTTNFLSQYRSSPVHVQSSAGYLVNAVAITASENTSCALLADGTAQCWGDNGAGQMGNGTYNAGVNTVQSVLSMTDMSSLSTGQSTCATKANGQVWCWGSNVYGQVGNGTITVREVSPVQSGAFPY